MTSSTTNKLIFMGWKSVDVITAIFTTIFRILVIATSLVGVVIIVMPFVSQNLHTYEVIVRPLLVGTPRQIITGNARLIQNILCMAAAIHFSWQFIRSAWHFEGFKFERKTIVRFIRFYILNAFNYFIE